MTQKKWFTLHHWAGFHLSLLLSFVLLTGTFATISTDLDWLANSAMQAENNVPKDKIINWPKLLNAVNQHYPNETILSIHRPAMA